MRRLTSRPPITMALPVDDDVKSYSQLWRARRNLVIAHAALHGASAEILAYVFDLTLRRVQQITAEFRSMAQKISEGNISTNQTIPPTSTFNKPKKFRNRRTF